MIDFLEYQLVSALTTSSKPDGTLLKGASPTVFVIEGGRRRPIASAQVFEAMGFLWNNIQTIADTDLNAFPLGPILNSREDGIFVKGSEVTIYMMEAGKRRGIPDMPTFDHLRHGRKFLILPQHEIQDIPLGAPLPVYTAPDGVTGGTA